MRYVYTAVDNTGARAEGEIEAVDLNSAIRQLAGRNLRPISIDPAGKKKKGSIVIFGGKITNADTIFLMRYLALMMRVGTDLLSAVDILIHDFDKPAMKAFLLEVKRNLSQGQQFYLAFAAHPKTFSPVLVNLIKAAEASGTMQSTFEQLTNQLQRDYEIRKSVKAAMIYPIILVIVGSVIVLFLSLFALPRIGAVFADTGVEPPLFSKVVFQVGAVVGGNVYLIIFGLIAAIVGFYLFFIRSLTGSRMLQRTLTRTPVVKRIYRDLATQRFASTFGSLLGAGLPIIEALHITADVVGVDSFRTALRRIADEGLARGVSIAESFRKEKVFPGVITNLIAISEKAGHLEEVLGSIADFYASNIQSSIKSLVAFIEPVLLLVMGMMVALVSLSIILPIYQLTTNF